MNSAREAEVMNGGECGGRTRRGTMGEKPGYITLT
jgi:hypothetical protein